MREQLIARKKLLEEERDRGQRSLAELEERKTQVRDTVLRIVGAIQVLDELLAEDAAQSDGTSGAAR